MTAKQKVISICEANQIEIDIYDGGIGRIINLIAPDKLKFQGGTHTLAAPTYYTCKYEVWNDILERLPDELPLQQCDCEDCNELPNP